MNAGQARRKAMAKLLLTLLVIVPILTGCTFPASGNENVENEQADHKNHIGIEDDVQDQEQTDSSGISGLCTYINGLTEDEKAAWERIGMNDAAVAELGESQQGMYYYDKINEQQKMVYTEVLMILLKSEENITVSETEESELELVFQAVLADHPEIFYVSGYQYTQYLSDARVQRISFTGTYTLTPEQIAAKQAEMEPYVENCLSGMPQGDDYTKLRYLYEYLIDHTDYVLNAPDNQSICSVFLQGQSVCQGYAKAYQYLCRRAGLSATLVTGTIRETGYGHAWNLVYADGDYYYVDATWGDASYTTAESGQAVRIPGINYEYLCITTEQINRTHEIDTIVDMPECTAMTDNFYVREGCYLSVYDPEELAPIFRNADADRQNYVTFCCATDELYDRYYQYLITEQGIFEYMNSEQGISYAENPSARTLGFWLP